MGQEIAARQLTELQAAFAHQVSLGLEPRQAAIVAGYASDNASVEAYRLLRSPHVLAAIHLEVRRRIVAGAPLAVGIVEALAKNEEISPKVRLDAARTLLDRAGHIAPRAIADKGAADLSLHEMSLGELRKLADTLEEEIAGRAAPISATEAPTPKQPVDLA